MKIEEFITAEIEGELFQGYIDAYYIDPDENYHILDWKTSTAYTGEKLKTQCGQLLVYAIGLNQKGVPFDKIKIGWDFLKYVSVDCFEEPKFKVSFTNVKGETKEKIVAENKIFTTIKAILKALLKKAGLSTEEIEESLSNYETNPLNRLVLPESVRENIQILKLTSEVKSRDVKRNEIGVALQAAARKQLKRYEYGDDVVDEYLKGMLDANSIEGLPREVQQMFEFRDCIVYVPITEELLKTWRAKIIAAIRDIDEREKDFKETGNEKVFWDTDENVEKQSYYFSTLCGYSANLHLPYKAYLERLEAKKDGTDMFNGVGNNMSAEGGTQLPAEPSEDQKKKPSNDDLSWLNEL